MIMVCVGFVSRSEEPRPRRALAHDSLLAHRARPDDQGLWPPPAFSRGGSQAEQQESQERLGTLGLGRAGCHRQRLRGTCVVAPPSFGSCWQIAPEDPGRSSGSWQTWPEAPGGRSSGSWQTAPEIPSGSWQAQTWWSSQGWQN